jgi:Zinc knuckle
MNANGNKEGEVLEEHALFTGQFKGKCRNCGQIGHFSARRSKSTM